MNSRPPLIKPEEALKAIAKQRDISDLIAEPRYLKGLLMDYCLGADYPKEFNLLVVACNVRIPQALQRPISSSLEVDPIPRLARKMVDEHGISENLAQWAVEAWANALEVKIPVLTLQVESVLLTPEPAQQVVPPSILVNVTKSDVIAHPDTSQVPARRSRVWVGGLISVVVGAGGCRVNRCQPVR